MVCHALRDLVTTWPNRPLFLPHGRKVWTSNVMTSTAYVGYTVLWLVQQSEVMSMTHAMWMADTFMEGKSDQSSVMAEYGICQKQSLVTKYGSRKRCLWPRQCDDWYFHGRKVWSSSVMAEYGICWKQSLMTSYTAVGRDVYDPSFVMAGTFVEGRLQQALLWLLLRHMLETQSYD